MSALTKIIERNAALYPDALHSIYGDHKLSFSQFADRARRLSSGLHKLGMRHQDRVAMLAMNCTEYIEAYGVAELTGFVLATVNWRLAAPEIAYVLKDAAPRVLIFESQYASLIEGLKADLPTIEHYVCIGTDVPTWSQGYEAVLASGDAHGAPVQAADTDLLCLIYTSGTTGRPKGCMITHGAHAFMADQSASYQAMLPGDKTMVIAPLFHVGARSQQLPMHMRGGSVVILRSFNPTEILETIARERITHVHMVPTMVQGVLDLPDNERYDTSSVSVPRTHLSSHR